MTHQFQGVIAVAAEAVNELLARNQSEAELKRLVVQLDLRERFVSLLTHDLRTPLTVARMNAEFIARRADFPEEARDCARDIVTAIVRSDRMITDLLDANRLRAGEPLHVARHWCDLKTIASETVANLKALHVGRCTLSCPNPIEGMWDPDAMRRVFENLLNNAVKYGSRDTAIEFELSLAGDRVHARVRNFGNALSLEEAAGLFNWFSRTQSAEKSSQPGWGLGLMVVKGLVEAHAGTVAVTSSATEGTVFTLDLPTSRRFS